MYAKHETENKQLDKDVLDLCVDSYKDKVKDEDSLKRLNFIKAQKGDRLLPSDVDEALIFVAKSTSLVHEAREKDKEKALSSKAEGRSN